MVVSMKDYSYIEGISMADVAYDARGETPSDLFVSAGLALEEVQVDLNTVEQKIEKEIQLSAPTIGDLLYDFLQELIFLKDAEQLVFNEFTIRIEEEHDVEEEENVLTLYCTAKGDTINHEKQKLGQDVKAVTLHHFNVEETAQGWVARVVLDI